MRTPSLTMRRRHDFLLQRTERPLHLARLLGVNARACRRVPIERGLDADEDLVELACCGRVLSAIFIAASVSASACAFTAAYTAACSRRSACTRSASIGPCALMNSSRSFFCSSIEAAIHCFDSSRPPGDELLGHLRGALFVELPRELGATGFDHHDRDVAVVEQTAGDHDLERRVVALLERGVRDPLAVVVREAHRADRAVERDAPDDQRGRRAVDRRDVVRVLQVGAEDGGDDLHLVAEPGRERRAQRPVGEPAGQDRLLAGATLTPEERAGDLARGVRPLLDVDRQREEVDALTGLRRGRRSTAAWCRRP